MNEEWLELTDGNQKLVMTRRELNNLAHRISRMFASVRPFTGDLPAESHGALRSQPLLEASVARREFDRRRKTE